MRYTAPADLRGYQSAVEDQRHSEVRQPRRLSSASTVLGIAINLLVALSPVYFLVFSILVLRQNGRPVELQVSQQLLQASIYGPTIFPVVFAAVVGKCLKSIADYRLQQGSTIATIEYLLASRTVSGAVIAPIRFRVYKLLVIALVILWSLSPLGSQASFRLVSTTNVHQSSSTLVAYLDVNHSVPLTAGADGAETYNIAVNAAFNAALFSPAGAKDASQDLYGYVKVPMLETLDDSQDTSNATSGWKTLGPRAYTQSIYSSLVGVPLSVSTYSGNLAFELETSYFSVDCSMSSTYLSNLSIFNDWANLNIYTSGIAWNGGQMAVGYDPAHYNDTSRARQITVWSGNRSNRTMSISTCNLTTTWIEAQVTCNDGHCNATAVRNSTIPHEPSTWSVMDDMQVTLPNVFNYFVNTSTKPHISTSSAIEHFLYDPTAPILSTTEITLSQTDRRLFSHRLSQLLNTYWLIILTPDGALGKDFTQDMDLSTSAQHVIGSVQTDELVLYCDRAWLVVLVLATLAMLAAGAVTTMLDARRTGPDIIDLFINSLRQNPHAHIKHLTSLEDGADQVRRLRNVEVRMCDVEPTKEVGYVAIATIEETSSIGPVTRSRSFR